MKTIGILGGFGPDATTEFENEVLRESRRRIPPRFNHGYPPMVTMHLRHPPIVLEGDAPPAGPLRLDPRVLNAARRLGELADFLVIAANTPHLFVNEIERAAGCEVLSMVDLVVDELRRRDAETVGLLGLGIPEAYVRRFRQEGIAYQVAPEAARAPLDEAILRTLEGVPDPGHRAAAVGAVRGLREAGIRPIVLGCTEIPLLLGAASREEDLVDPGLLLARAAVEKAVA